PVEEQPQKQSLNDQFRHLRARAQAAEKERNEYRTRYEEATRYREPPPPPQPIGPSEEQIRAQLENMGDVDRFLWMKKEMAQQAAVERQNMQMRQMILEDKISVDGVLAANPDYNRYRDTVEKEFHSSLQKGQPRTREELLHLAIGREVMTNGAAAVAKARKAGAA